jgi:hypothetical protein
MAEKAAAQARKTDCGSLSSPAFDYARFPHLVPPPQRKCDTKTSATADKCGGARGGVCGLETTPTARPAGPISGGSTGTDAGTGTGAGTGVTAACPRTPGCASGAGFIIGDCQLSGALRGSQRKQSPAVRYSDDNYVSNRARERQGTVDAQQHPGEHHALKVYRSASRPEVGSRLRLSKRAPGA